MRTAIKADFLSSKSFLLKTIVNKGITRDFRSLFVTYTVLYSKLIRDYTKGIYLLEETFAPNGATLHTKHNPTYEQLNKKWQKYCFYDYLDDLYNEKAGYSK